MPAGVIVHVASSVWARLAVRYVALFFRIANNMYATKVITRVTMSIAWSCRAVSCSMTGEAASWSISWPHVDMFIRLSLFYCLFV